MVIFIALIYLTLNEATSFDIRNEMHYFTVFPWRIYWLINFCGIPRRSVNFGFGQKALLDKMISNQRRFKRNTGLNKWWNAFLSEAFNIKIITEQH